MNAENTSKKIVVRQVRSIIGRSAGQRKVMRALGITKMNQTVIHYDTPIIRGMVAKVAHLVDCQEA